MFKKFCNFKKKWDGLPVFTQETIYPVRTEMRQSLRHSKNRPSHTVHLVRLLNSSTPLEN